MFFQETKFKGLILIDLDLKLDSRGFFARTFCEQEFSQAGLPTRFTQSSLSCNTTRGIIRGMHFQLSPKTEGKIVRCLKGTIYDVALDLRPDSPTFCQWLSFELSASNRRGLYLPPGFAHGFQNLTDQTEVSYQMTESYDLALNTGVRWNDPAFKIQWPIPNPILSSKDSAFPDFVL